MRNRKTCFAMARASRRHGWYIVKDTAIHDIDVMHFISGEQPTSVYAKVGSMRIKKFEDYAHIMLTYKDGKSASTNPTGSRPTRHEP